MVRAVAYVETDLLPCIELCTTSNLAHQIYVDTRRKANCCRCSVFFFALLFFFPYLLFSWGWVFDKLYFLWFFLLKTILVLKQFIKLDMDYDHWLPIMNSSMNIASKIMMLVDHNTASCSGCDYGYEQWWLRDMSCEIVVPFNTPSFSCDLLIYESRLFKCPVIYWQSIWHYRWMENHLTEQWAPVRRLYILPFCFMLLGVLFRASSSQGLLLSVLCTRRSNM